MKTLIRKHTVPLLITFLMFGCTPDSLTKYKKEEPKKASSSTSTTPTTIAGGVPVSDIINPTLSSITYANSVLGTRTDLVFKKDSAFSYNIYGDNSFSSQTLRNAMLTNCSISPTVLPTGLFFNTSNCTISGTPTEVYTDPTTFNLTGKGRKAYTVTMSFYNSSNTITTHSLPITLQVLQEPTKLLYTQSSRVLLKIGVDGIASFDPNSGNYSTNDGTSPTNVKKKTIKGTVQTVDTTNGYIGVQNVSTTDYLGFVTGYTDLNSDYRPDTNPHDLKYYFEIGNTVDNNSTYFSDRGKITEIINVIPSYASAPVTPPVFMPIELASEGVNSNDVTSKRNYLEFKVSPILPTGFELDSLTGIITAPTVPVAIPASEATTYRVSASNEFGVTYYDFRLEIIDTPTRASLTRRQLLTLSSLTMSYIKEGDTIVTPIVGLTPSVHGLVTKKISATNQIEVIALDGQFQLNDQIDIGQTFNAMVGTVLAKPINFNAAIVTAANVTVPAGGVAVGDMWVENNTTAPITSSRVYVTATDDTTITSGSAFLTSTILEIDAEAIGVNLTADPAGNKTGYDFVSADADANGYVYEDAGANLSISNILRSINLRDTASRIFRQGDDIVFDERVLGATATGEIAATAGAIQFKNYFIFERSLYSYYKVNTVTGSGITYSISPALPAGITLNPKTGILSGTPTERGAKTSYVITAKNLLGSTTVNVDIEVRDYFKLVETSNAPSFKLHRFGDYQNNRTCRVNGSDIFNQTGNLDIRCMLEGEEQDLHTIAMKLKATVGPGLCQHVSITPYHFWKWAPKKTEATVRRWTNYSVLTKSDRAITSALDCDGNYTLEGGPNCDEGSIKVLNYSYDPTRVAPATVVQFDGEETISCGGKAINCLDGSLKDVLTDAAIAAGNRGQITASETGFNQTWTFTTPSAKGHYTNLYVANNLNGTATVGNQCTGSYDDVLDNMNAYYANIGVFTRLVDTSTIFTTGTDTTFYGTSKFTINGVRRGTFTTENVGAPYSPNDSYKTAQVYSKTNPFDGALPYYYISCLDAAKESKATITVVVREWNKTFRIQDEIDQDYPDVSLAAQALPILMRATGGTVLSPINDFSDWGNNYTYYQTFSPYNKASNAANYGGCAAVPAYVEPTNVNQLLGVDPSTPFPAANEFQFPELGL